MKKRVYSHSDQNPAVLKQCSHCKVKKSLSSFALRNKGKHGRAGTCEECKTLRYLNEKFTCTRCSADKPGSDFYRGDGASVIIQPCKECKTAAKEARTRLRRIKNGKSPYHILSEVDPDSMTASCRECGPTHIYRTGAKSGRGWRCGTRGDETSRQWYDKNAVVMNKHASRRWHRLTEVDGQAMTGVCTQCGPTVVRWNQGESRFVCRSPERKRAAAAVERKRKRIKKYGITEAQYDAMLAQQGGQCSICRSDSPARRDSDIPLVVDHDHDTGEVRGLLCSLCNSGLGMFREQESFLQEAIAYLVRAKRLQERKKSSSM